jgi:hypothetical protein
MNNIQIIEITGMAGNVEEHVIIDRGNNEYTSMLKSVYEEKWGTIENE